MKDITLEEYKDLVQHWEKFLLFFSWTNCPRCRMQEAELERVEPMSTVPMYRTNAEEDQSIANELTVLTIPYIILIQNWEKYRELWEVNKWETILELFDIFNPEYNPEIKPEE